MCVCRGYIGVVLLDPTALAKQHAGCNSCKGVLHTMASFTFSSGIVLVSRRTPLNIFGNIPPGIPKLCKRVVETRIVVPPGMDTVAEIEEQPLSLKPERNQSLALIPKAPMSY